MKAFDFPEKKIKFSKIICVFFTFKEGTKNQQQVYIFGKVD